MEETYQRLKKLVYVNLLKINDDALREDVEKYPDAYQI